MNVQFSCYCFLMVPVIGTISFFIRNRLRQVNQEIRSRLSAAIAFLAENLSGMAVIQVFGRQQKQQEEFDLRNKALLESTIKESRLNTFHFLVAEHSGMWASPPWFGLAAGR
jgi:ATP-binding cassette subfamily B multidrug efflux pump